VIDSQRVLGLVPARGGSKGLPGKNILPLTGKPLIGWTIEQALRSELLDAIVVTTEDPEIAQTALAFGAEVPFVRPTDLASDISPSIDAVFHALDWLATQGRGFDMVALLEPTSPLRAPDDIDRAVRLLASSPAADAVVSVGEVHLEHPSIVKRLDSGKLTPYVQVQSRARRRQDLGRALFPYGVIYLSRTNSLRKTRSFYPDATLPLLIERWQNYEIDDMYDFVCVEAILKYRLEEKQG
jgi:CMP-N,N'-diacetyllegionaminic acid synthase